MDSETNKPALPPNATRAQQVEYNRKHGRNAGKTENRAPRRGIAQPVAFLEDVTPQNGPVPDYIAGDENKPVEGNGLAETIVRQKVTIQEMQNALDKSLEDNRLQGETSAVIQVQLADAREIAERCGAQIVNLKSFMQSNASNKLDPQKSVVESATAWMIELQKLTFKQADEIRALRGRVETLDANRA